MLKRILIYFFVALPVLTYGARKDSTIQLYTGVSIFNFGAPWLDNSSSQTQIKSWGIHAGIRWYQPEKYFNWSLEAGLGNYKDLGSIDRPWNEKGNFARIEALSRLNIMRFFGPIQSTPFIPEAFFGYVFDYVPMHNELGFNALSTGIEMGFSAQYQSQNGFSYGFSTALNQRLGANFRTYLKYDFSVLAFF